MTVIKLIKPGKTYVLTCSRCDAVFTYQDGDITYAYGHWLKCPECGETNRADFIEWNSEQENE